jgi:hypothetical protein
LALDPANVVLPLDDSPNPEAEADKALVGEVSEKYTRWRTERLAHEITWFFNAAFVRGIHWMAWSNALRQIEAGQVPSYRVRVTANLVLAKHRARKTKFLKNRFEPHVIPFSGDRQDKLDARATKRCFDYFHQKEQVEQKYRRVLNWSTTCSKGFLWLYWDPNKQGYVSVPDPATGKNTIKEAKLGDVCAEAGGPFEVLVSDPGASTIGEQPEIMRVKLRLVSDMQARYPDKKDQIKGDVSSKEAFNYQRQIASLAARGSAGTAISDPQSGDDDTMPYVTVKELFTAPCGKYAKGRHVTVAGEVLLKKVDELPYGFHDIANPYPCEEFADLEMAGQFWPPTMVEQTIGIQKEYNLLRSKIAEQVKLMAHPKVIVPVQCQWPEGAWTGKPGEVIRIILPPGAQGPQVVNPSNIASDVWRTLELIKKEFDDITSIYPASQGASGGETSGFQVNLLQEAADSIHAPDIRLHELAFEAFYYKVRRMMKRGYTVPRMISIAGRNFTPEVFEFSSQNIDEHAEVKIFAGAGLSSSPAIKNKQVLELHASGLLGAPDSPETQRRVMRTLDVGGLGDLQEENRRDEELARRENDLFKNGQPWQQVRAFPFHDHETHWSEHADVSKLPEFDDWSEEAKLHLFCHLVDHASNANPTQVQSLAMKLRIPPEMIAPLFQELQAGGDDAAPASAGHARASACTPTASATRGGVTARNHARTRQILAPREVMWRIKGIPTREQSRHARHVLQRNNPSGGLCIGRFVWTTLPRKTLQSVPQAQRPRHS